MKCPICGDETAGQENQRWGPEWAHVQCVKAYNLGACDARASVCTALRNHILIYQVDDDCPNREEAADRIMEKMLNKEPK